MSSDKYQRETILVIEDDAGIVELEQMQLERAGFTVVTAGTSEEALDRLRRHHVDLLLLDYRLSGNLDGLDVYLECKAMGFELPVILVTGFSNEAVAIRALRAGVRDLITKSAEYLDYLPEAVERVLRQVRTERQLAESEARLTSIIDSANDAIIIAETGLQITLFNQAAEAMFRCPASDALGQPVSRFIPQDERKSDDSQPERESLICLSSYGNRGVRMDGTEFPLELSVSRTDIGGRRFYTVIVRDITERKRAEGAMRQRIELQDQLAKIAASVPGVIYSFRLRPDGSSCVPFAVPAIEDLFGIPREALAEDLTPLFANVHPDDLQPLRESIAEASRLPSEWHNTYRYLHRASGERWIEGWSAPQSQIEPDGSIVWHGFLMDVTERKQAEEEIRELNASLERRVAERTAELESMLASATIGLCFFDRDIRFLRINHCLAQINGIPVEAHLGRPLREVLPGMAETVEPIVRRIFETGRPVAEMEIEGTTPALPGERRSWLQGFYPVPGADGTIISVGATVTEITDRKRAEDKLAELNRVLVAEIAEKERVEQQVRRLAAILEASPDFVGMADPEGRVLFLNRAFTESLGRSPEREPLTISDCHPVDTVRVIHDDGIPTAARTGFWRGETEFLTHQGRPIPVSQLILGHSNPEGTLEFYSTIMRDISERKQMETALRNRGEELAVANAELARAARLKDEFLASMSHELRTPLNGILGISEVLQEHVYGPLNAKQLSALRDLEECGRHLLALINDILDVAKIEAGKVQLEPGAVAVDQLCQASLRMVKEPALKKKITVSLHLDKSVRVFTADERRLKQVLVNLLSNAVKFTAEGGQVGLDVVGDEDEGQVRLTVWDTGIGIPPEDVQRLFQPFVQLDSRLSRQYEGTGLGLALVKRLTELHGGRVLVESRPGKGSRFTVVLPWTRELPAPESSECGVRPPEQSRLHQSSQESSGGPLILVVDDKPQNTRGLVDYLIFKGYRVVCAASGIEGIELAKRLLPDMILMDIQMPHMDGLEAIRRIRLVPGLRMVPIIALTALAMPGDRERSLEAGATEYVFKPIILDRCRQVIESLLNP